MAVNPSSPCGRCRHCQAQIAWHYPLLEALTAALFIWSVHSHAHWGPALAWAGFATTLLALAGMLVYIWFRFEMIYGVAAVVAAPPDGLVLSGKTATYLGIEGRVRYEARVRAMADGGTVSTEGDALAVAGGGVSFPDVSRSSARRPWR